MTRVLVAGLLSLAIVGLADAAAACSSPGPDFLLEEMTGGEPPDQPQGITYEITRGKADQSEGCGLHSSSSCDDTGAIELRFPTPGDADSTTDNIGYEVTLVSGKLPDNASLDARARSGFRDSGQTSPTHVWVHWLDGATDDQESLDLTVTVTAVDRNGNRSAPSEPVHITDDAGDACSVSPRGRASSLDVSWLVLGASLLWLSRRQAR